MLNRLRDWVSAALPSQPAHVGPTDVRGISHHEVVPGRLAVTAYEQTFDRQEAPAHCWTFVTDGFARASRKEIVLSIERGAEELSDCTRGVIDLFQRLYLKALDGSVFDLGAIERIPEDSPGLLGDDRLRGIAFIPAEPLIYIQLASPSITALLLTQNEMDAAKRFGLVRLMGLLGFRYRYFPTAPWVVRGRPDMTSPEAMASSILNRTGIVRLSNCRAYLRGIETRREPLPPTGILDNDRVTFARQEIVLEVSETEAHALGRLLIERGHSAAMALMACPDPEADASLVWVPGGVGWTAIWRKDGTATRMAGNHVIFLAEQDRDEAKIVEDGFAVLLRDQTWLEICQVFIGAPQNWGMPYSGDIGFRLKVIP